MRYIFHIMLAITVSAFIGGVIAFICRRVWLGFALAGSGVASFVLGYWAGTQSDPPSLLPIWAWLVGLCIGAAPGHLLRRSPRA
jgi:hypothetical protein